MKSTRFPLGIATGAAFCDRLEERQHLVANVTAGRHTLVLAPRRYGKTSLVLRVLDELGMVDGQRVCSSSADFLIAHDAASVQRTLLDVVGKVTADILPLHERALQTLRQFFESLKPEITVSETGGKVRFTPSSAGLQDIVEALVGLDNIAGAKEMRAVLIMDEFQQIGTLKEGQSIEASIRHAAERVQHTSYVFSGSNRHTLSRAFDDDARPLFHVCDQLTLDRIVADHYRPFLREAAREIWSTPLDRAPIEAILGATARHPYYVNLLCARLWRSAEPPTVEAVEAEWAVYVTQEPNWHANEVSQLSPNQRAVLAALAIEPTDQPHSKEFLLRTRLAGASSAQAIQVLLERDLIYRDEAGLLRVLDPALERYLVSLAS